MELYICNKTVVFNMGRKLRELYCIVTKIVSFLY